MVRAASKGRSAGGLIIATAMFFAVALASPANAQDTDGLIPEGDWSDEQIDYMLDLIDETEQVLPETFPASGPSDEVEAELEAMGYFNFGVPAPGGYWHMINPGFIADTDDMLNPATAESLVYQDDGAGNWRLVSAMYMAGPDQTVEDLPEDLAWLPGWHGHPELCTWDDGEAFGRFAGVTDPDNPDCPEGSSTAPTPVMMHVWIEDNGVCDHRFGGVGVGGIHCDHGGHNPDHPPGHQDPPGDDHDHGDDDHDDDDGHNDDHDDDDDGSSAPAAQPVTGKPSFTG